MKRHFAEAPFLAFQKEGCTYATRPLRKHASPPRKKKEKKFRNEKWDTAGFFLAYFRMFSPGVTWGLATIHRCSEVGRSTLRLAFFRQWPFNNSDPFLYSLYIISFLKLTCNIFYNFLKFSGNEVNVDMLYFTLVWKHVLNKPVLLLLLLLLSWSFFNEKVHCKR